MSVRPHKTKPGVWIIDYYPLGRKGKRLREQFPGSEGAARAYEAEMRKAHMPDMPINPKVIDVYPDWLGEYRSNISANTYRDAETCFKSLLPFFGQRQLSRITQSVIETYKARRLSDIAYGRKKGPTVSKRTINKELCYLSSLINWAVERGHAHPLPFKIKKFARVRSAKTLIPTRQEMQRIYKAIEPRYKPLFLLLYDGGMRRSEVMTLRVQDVHIEQGVILIKGKGSKERLVPITTGRLRAALETAIGKRTEGYLVVNPHTKKPYYSIRKALMRAAKKAEVHQRVYHHLLRHSFGTHSAEAGVDLRALQAIMGHSTIKVTEIYTHMGGEFIRREGSKFDDYIRTTETPETPAVKGSKKEPVS